MTDEFDFLKFTNLSKKGWNQALEYKNKCIPDKLYHYYNLFDNNYRCYREKNKGRLNDLQDGKIWVSSFDALNDPFEFNCFYFDPESNEILRQNSKFVDMVLKLLKQKFQVFCLSENFNKNMPLWAHYSNNHKGYCVEYSIIDKTSIFPIIYIPQRGLTPNTITTLITEFYKSYKNNTKPSSIFNKSLMHLFISFTAKHELWKYEGEFRLFWEKSNFSEGQLVNFADAKLNINKIFTGLKCDYKKELRKIGRILGCEVQEMFLDNTNSEFSLKSRKIV